VSGHYPVMMVAITAGNPDSFLWVTHCSMTWSYHSSQFTNEETEAQTG
jgi:hypothetical protein